MKLAAIQMNSGADVTANFEQLRLQLARVRQQGAELVVLPENFALMSENRGARLELAEAAGDGPLQQQLRELATEFGIWIVAGTLPIRSEDPQRPWATCFVYDNAGEQVARYDKIHLFDVQVPTGDSAAENDSREIYQESSFTAAGATPVVVDTPWGRLGLAVCYDLRFPELFRELSVRGLDLLAIPAAFTVTTGRAHWELLLRARAVENLAYIVAAAQVWGSSWRSCDLGPLIDIGPMGYGACRCRDSCRARCGRV